MALRLGQVDNKEVMEMVAQLDQLRLEKQQIADELAEAGREGFGQRRVRAAQNLDDEAAHVARVEGAAERRHLVEEAAHRPHVRAVVVRLVVADLGGHVVPATHTVTDGNRQAVLAREGTRRGWPLRVAPA